MALLATVGALLMMWQLPYPGAEWLKLDLSDIPALIGGFALGPWIGLAVVLLKNFLFVIFRLNPQELIGVPMNIIANGSMVLISAFLYGRLKTRGNAVISLVIGVAASVLLMIPANLLVLPLYIKLFIPGLPVPPRLQLVQMIMAFVLPFNALKGVANGILTFIIYKRMALFLRPEGELGLAQPPVKTGESGVK